MYTTKYYSYILPEIEKEDRSGYPTRNPEYKWIGVEKENSGRHDIRSSSTRSHPLQLTRFRYLSSLQTVCRELLVQEEDLNQCINHVTKAILLPHGVFQSSQEVVYGFSLLASGLLFRFALYKRPEDIESSLKYFHHLRGKFHFFGAFHLPSDWLTSNHIRALAYHVMLSNEVVEEMEEVADLCRELLALNNLTSHAREAFFDFSIAAVEIYRRGDAKQPLERVVDVLRVAMTRNPDWHHVSFALVHCLAINFEMTHDIDLYEEAMTIADSIVASRNPEDSLSPTQKRAVGLILTLIMDRLNFYAQLEYMTDSISRLQILLDIPSLSKQLSSSITELLGRVRHRRRDYLNAMANPTRSNPSVADPSSSFSSTQAEFRWNAELVENAESEAEDIALLLRESLIAIRKNKPTNIEETIKYGRILVPSPHSSRHSLISPVNDLAEFLFEAYRQTSRLEYLNEAIIMFRRVLHVSGTNTIHSQVAEGLLHSIDERWRLFQGKQDFEEMMSLLPEIVTSRSEAPFHRFPFSCKWASKARAHALPCTTDAYDNGMSLMQETLVFSPTLQTQHSRLVETLREFEGVSLDYASYQIETIKPEQAVETLERGRALLWSEMRGFRPSIDQLFAAEPDLAAKIAEINKELEEVTMSVVQIEGMEFYDHETDSDEGVDALCRPVLRKW